MVTGRIVLQYKIFIFELHSIDGLSTRAVSTSEVTSLAHEARNDAMEGRPYYGRI